MDPRRTEMERRQAEMMRGRSAPSRSADALQRRARATGQRLQVESNTLNALVEMLGRKRPKAPKRTAGRKIPPAVGLRRRFPGAPAGMHPSEINRNFGGANNSGGATAPGGMSPARRQYRATHGRNYRQRHPWREQRDLQKPRTLY